MTTEKKSIQVASALAGKRLDVALPISGLTISRAQAQRLITEHLVWVNGKRVKSSYKLQEGDQVEVEIPAPRQMDLTPYDFPLDVTYEDDQVIVVNKPAGLVVHPAYGHENDTLINALLARETQLSSHNEDFRPGLVHRIDKGTSGLLVLAKTDSAHTFLAKQFLRKTIHRRYWALCFSNKNIEDGKIESFLSRDQNDRKRFSSSENEDGKYAVTHYKTLSHHPPFRLFQLELETGRTHQIRVHLSSEKNPIVGDETYGGQNQAKNLKNQRLKKLILEMDRFALHARELGFMHPTKKEFMTFSVPIAEDLEELFNLGGFSDYLG
jgi:23S rRNA pseudouridine1911/1915/1917 synthase